MQIAESEYDYIAHIDLGAVIAQAERSLFLAANSAAFALLAAEAISLKEICMPGALMKLQDSGNVEAVSKAFPSWLAGMTFRDYVGRFSAFLEELGFIASLIRRSRNENETWSAEKTRKQLNKLNFPGKFDYLQKITQRTIPRKLRADLDSVIQARNCYEHRKGLVADTDTQTGNLTVTWRAIEFVEQKPDGARVIIKSLPHTIEEGNAMIAQIVDRQKTFALGEVVEFSGPEIWEIGFSLRAAVSKLVIILQEFARPLAIRVNEPQEANDDERLRNTESGVKAVQGSLDYYPESE